MEREYVEDYNNLERFSTQFGPSGYYPGHGFHGGYGGYYPTYGFHHGHGGFYPR